MASIFSHNRILPNLKRRSRPTNKAENSPAKAKPLHILPNVAEEDEYPSRQSCSSLSSLPTNPNPSSYQSSPFVTASATLGARPTHDKRDSRRVVLTGVEGLTFDDFFPPSSAPRVRTPSPPPRPITPPPRSVTSSSGTESPLDDINLRFSGLGISLDFPSPPSSATRNPSFSRNREQSPSPSLTSSDASTCSPKTPCSTPPTSDDDESPSKESHLMRAPTFKSQRASVLFMQSMPDLAEAPRKTSITSLLDDDVSEEVAWFAQDISEIVTLASPLPPAFPLEASGPARDPRARPDSVVPLPRKHSRGDRPVPTLPRISIQDSGERSPSAQLDPTFPSKRRSYLIPSRPPPPPPVCCPPRSPSLSAMEQATEELLAELANAALGAGFLGTELTFPHSALSDAGSVPPSPSSHFIVKSPLTPCSAASNDMRPPPRSSVPADIFDFCDSPIDTPSMCSFFTPPTSSMSNRLNPQQHQWPTTPVSAVSMSVYSQTDSAPASPLSSFDFDIDVSHVRAPSERPATPDSPMRVHAPTPRRMPSMRSVGSAADQERTLRSRWSTSTLGSIADSHGHSWLGRFTLSPSKKGKGGSSSKHAAPQPAPVLAPVNTHLQRKNAVKSSHSPKRSMDSERGVSRRDSRSSRVSESSASDSGESTASSGLRRKPIPLVLLSTAAGPANAMQM
ncbi:hypothetical protein BD309DRAFT_1068269 [Dichomitus squalens]|nr:hypothetical protein BD309DRAFT_1068269 [Dichomitus squalens]